MMKKLFLILCALMPLAGYADESYDRQQLETKCQHEQSSLMRDRYGTPSCDQLDRIMHHNRTPAVVQSTVVAPNTVKDEGRHWNGTCYVNNHGDRLNCPN